MIPALFLFTTSQSRLEDFDPLVNKAGVSAEALKREFDMYLLNFKPAKLPLVFNSDDNSPEYLPHPNPYLYPYYTKNFFSIIPYGYISLADNKIALIVFYTADSYLVVIETYSSEGVLINNEQISLGACGPDACFNCEEYTIINKDLTFKSSHTGVYTDCEGDNSIISRTTINQSGKVLQNGKIELGEEILKRYEKGKLQIKG